MKARRAGQAGFTLLEVLVALAVLSLAIVVSIQGFAQGLRLLKLSGDHQNAMLLADQKMREMVEPVEGRDGGTEGPYRWERVTTAIVAPDLIPTGSIARGRLFTIDVRVSWDERRQIEIKTLRLAPTVASNGTPLLPTSPTSSSTTSRNSTSTTSSSSSSSTPSTLFKPPTSSR